jgi:hypothetical protein
VALLIFVHNCSFDYKTTGREEIAFDLCIETIWHAVPNRSKCDRDNVLLFQFLVDPHSDCSVSLVCCSQYLTKLLAKHQKVGPFMQVLPICNKMLSQGEIFQFPPHCFLLRNESFLQFDCAIHLQS